MIPGQGLIHLDHYERTRVGCYAGALEKAVGGFAAGDPSRMAELSGGACTDNRLFIACLGHELEVSHPDGAVRFRGTRFAPNVSLSIVTLNHLSRADGAAQTGRLVPYRELPDGHVFHGAFARYALATLLAGFADSPERLAAAARPLGGEPVKGPADCTVRLPFFPRLPLTIQVWGADDELPGSANVLFDAIAPHYIHTEDAAAVGSYAAHLLVAMGRGACPADLADLGVV